MAKRRKPRNITLRPEFVEETISNKVAKPCLLILAVFVPVVKLYFESLENGERVYITFPE